MCEMEFRGYNEIGKDEINDWLRNIEESLVACYLHSLNPRLIDSEYLDNARASYFIYELDKMRERIHRRI